MDDKERELRNQGYRQAPISFKEYLKSSQQSVAVFRWIWEEVISQETKKVFYWVCLGFLATIFFNFIQAGGVAMIFTGLATRNYYYIVAGVTFFVSFLLAQKVSERCLERGRHLMVTQAQQGLEDTIVKLFTEKSIGQHLEEGSRLSTDTLATGKGQVYTLFSLIAYDAVYVILQIAVAFVLLVAISLMAGSILAGVFLIYIAWSIYLNYRVMKDLTPIDRDYRVLRHYRADRLETIIRVKVNGKEGEERRIMDTRFAEISDRNTRFWFWHMNVAGLRSLVHIVGYTLIMVWGAWLVWHGHWEIGVLYPLFSWSSKIVENLWRLSSVEHEISWVMPSIRVLIDALTMKPDVIEAKNPVGLNTTVPPRIEFENLSHTYAGTTETDHPPVLKNVSFTIEPGEKVALLGPSGAGKTTIMSHLLRFMDPTSGRILIDGHDLRNVSHRSWTAMTGYIPQQSQVLDGTIRDNLTYGLPEGVKIPDEKIWSLMRMLKIDFGARLVKGLETVVGKRGMKLSGGQGQRLMIGAAVIKNPLVMVIDEATSSLDSDTESQVQEGLATALAGNVSALVIAHRLSTVRHMCTKFVVIKQADEVSNGESQVEAVASSFEELYQISPLFRRLADKQGVKIDPHRITLKPEDIVIEDVGPRTRDENDSSLFVRETCLE